MAAPITVYHYPFSPYGQRITWYLALRGLPYAECDRDDFFASPGYKWDAQSRKEQRPASLRKMADMFTLLEETLLADGRPWVLGTPQPSLADIEAVGRGGGRGN